MHHLCVVVSIIYHIGLIQDDENMMSFHTDQSNNDVCKFKICTPETVEL